MKEQFLTTKYALLQGAYWLMYCGMITYASVYLLGEGFKAGEIGILLALSNGITAILQTVLAAEADRREKPGVKGLMCFVTAVGLLLTVFLIVSKGKVETGILFTASFVAIFAVLPLVNSLAVKYLNQNYKMNFGIGRGVGSFAYALGSVALGVLIDNKGSFVIPIFSLACGLLFMGAAMGFKGPVIQNREKSHKAAAKSRSVFEFIRRYPGFMIVILGYTWTFVFFFMSSNYLIQIMELFGGSSRDVGIAAAIGGLAEIPPILLFTRIVKKVKAKHLMILSGAAIWLRSIGTLMAGSVFVVKLVFLTELLGYGIYASASVFYANEVMEDQDISKGQAMMTVSYVAGGIIGSAAGGQLVEHMGVKAMLLGGLIFSSAGLLLIALGVLYPFGSKRAESPESI